MHWIAGDWFVIGYAVEYTGTLQIIYGFILYQETFEGVIIPIYIILFGAMIVFMVFYIPQWLLRNIPFYTNTLGRGLTFLFNALLVIDPTGIGLIAGGYISLLSMLYIILWILNEWKCTNVSLPPPFFFTNRDNEQHAYTQQLARQVTINKDTKANIKVREEDDVFK